MKMLTTVFKPSLYSPIDLDDLGTRLWNAGGSQAGSEQQGVQVAEALMAALGTLSKAIDRVRANPITAEIRMTDTVRGNDLLMIRDILRANSHKVKDPAVQAAARDVLGLYKQYAGRLVSMGVAAESTAVKSLLDCLSSQENRDKCALLGIVPLVQELGKTQAELEALYVNRVSLEPERAKYTLRNASQKAIFAIRAFLEFVDIMVATGREDFAALHDRTFRIIKDVEAVARSRATRARNGQTEQPVEAAVGNA